MADNSKKDKIAAARKKLKQFQKKGNSTPPQKVRSSADGGSDVSSGSQLVDSRAEPIGEQKQLRPTASTESLQQISRQLNGLLAESSSFLNGEGEMDNSSTEELETRNRELAALLEKHMQANEQLNTQVLQIKDHANSLQDQLEHERDTFSHKMKKDVGALKEQLQVHIQTIGILVAEKTELQTHLVQSQKIGEKRFDEIEELTGRLKASRQRVADLERSLSSTNNSSQQFEKSSKDYAKDVDRLKLDLYKSNKEADELRQQTSELSERLNAKVSESSALQHSVDEHKKKLEMAELYTQQLTNQSDVNKESLHIVDQLQEEKNDLVIQVQQYSEAFQKVTSERDQISEQYQDYIDKLQHQSQQLTQQLTLITEEREQLLVRSHTLEAMVHEMQSKLEEAEFQNSATDKLTLEISPDVVKLRSDYEDICQRHEAQIRDNAQLSRLLEEKELRILELDDRVTEMDEEAGDKTQLLENIQSDKTALSRALMQNKDLKQQLGELQTAFVKLSNDNMELLTQLQTESHASQDLAAKLSQQEDDLKALREELTQKEQEIAKLHKASTEIKKEEYQQDQMQDRLRHYEAQAQLVDTIQRELINSQDMVDALTTQNSELRMMLIKATETKPQINGEMDNAKAAVNRDELMSSLNDTIQQLQMERSQLMDSLREQRDLSDSLGVKVADLQEEVFRKSTFTMDNEKISLEDFQQLKHAMDLIEERYTKAMRDKADLSDKAEQLEHMVLQLQGESETIGEYISLYHHQRALLQQRENQKNDYIAQLASDREEMQVKLGELQALVMQLLGESNMLHSYHKESHRPPSHTTDSAIQPHLKADTRLVNGTQNNEHDWPDYTSSESDSDSEVETIIGGQALPADISAESSPTMTTNPVKAPPHRQSSHVSSVDKEEKTALKIMNLLSEIGHSNLVEKDIVEQNFHPCKFCKGSLQVL